MKNRIQIILSCILCLVPIVIGLFLWDQLPDQVAIHFNSAGDPDNYVHKAIAVFALPVMFLAINGFSIFMISKDPKKQNHPSTLIGIIIWLIPITGIVILTMTYYNAMNVDVPIGVISKLIVGLTTVIVGNYLPKCKQNYVIGIRISWTLNDTNNWNFTHRISGFIWVIGGLAIIVAAFFETIYALLIIFILMVTIPFILSYSYYVKHKNDNTNQ